MLFLCDGKELATITQNFMPFTMKSMRTVYPVTHDLHFSMSCVLILKGSAFFSYVLKIHSILFVEV